MERVGNFFIGLLGPLFLGAIVYMFHFDNQAISDVVQVLVEIVLLWLSFRYFQKSEIDKLRFPTKKQWLIFLLALVTIFLYSAIYSSVFVLHSRSGTDITNSLITDGYQLLLVLSITIFAPLEEELFLRGFIQKGAFKNTWLGIVLTSSIFSILHGPETFASFGYYALFGAILGTAYKKSNNLWVSILCHAGINTIILIVPLLV
ncbi:CPBP family intramembrane glutamic endopeptidase [Streptococcus pacificus]|uniref:CPBP family intramembrane metalloprotease n=1 Tax=Streptococcus pacificus TaxID=2740577 RepID=A0ABS0ZJ81_9STRE|nr:type II CAAX endopeptidase family protein [Streptococcus pacificus]MBJ8326049.1 CPBP family intramembrane metalloprotease [Streptococcus pacificus]